MNKEEKKIYFKHYFARQENKIKQRLASRKYYRNNREKSKNWVKEWIKAHPEKKKAWDRRYNKEHIEKRIEAVNRRRMLKLNVVGSHTSGEWELLKKQYGLTCPCCGKTEPTVKLTKDHIIPLTRGGSDYIENIQPLCQSCNSKKGNRVIIKFVVITYP